MLESLFAQFDSIVVLDTETTGFSPRSDEVIELALLRVPRARRRSMTSSSASRPESGCRRRSRS